jgi:MerR family mercuric resistance operon transcriptional regulator
LALEHVQDIRRKITDLRKLKAVLETMASQCYGGKMPKCPIIDALFDVRGADRSSKTRA